MQTITKTAEWPVQLGQIITPGLNAHKSSLETAKRCRSSCSRQSRLLVQIANLRLWVLKVKLDAHAKVAHLLSRHNGIYDQNHKWWKLSRLFKLNSLTCSVALFWILNLRLLATYSAHWRWDPQGPPGTPMNPWEPKTLRTFDITFGDDITTRLPSYVAPYARLNHDNLCLHRDYT